MKKKPHNPVRALRKAKGMNQEELAEMAGLSTSTISRLETGKLNYERDTLEAVAKALDCHVVQLLGGVLLDDRKKVLVDLADKIPPDRLDALFSTLNALGQSGPRNRA